MPAELKRVEGGVAVVADGQQVVVMDSETQARQLLDWVTYQLKSGMEPDQIAAMLRGEAVGGSEPDLSILDGSIGDLKKALASGDHDEHLDALVTAETDGKGRKGALDALEARR